MPPIRTLHRHDWVWLADDWADHLRHDLPADALTLLADWLCAKRPLVVARRSPDAPQHLNLGLALPGKRRIGVVMDAKAIACHARPLPLAAVLNQVPQDWRLGLATLEDACESQGIALGVYGSVAWQYVANDPDMIYVTASSDVDLAFRPTFWSQIKGLLEMLDAFERIFPTPSLGPRLDGEIISPNGVAFAWRELATDGDTVLTKSASRLEMTSREHLKALFQAGAT